MRCLLMVPLLAALVATPYAGAQHAASAGHSGGFSAPHLVAPAPQMSGGFGAGSHFASPAMAPRSFNTPPQYHWSVPARALGTPQNSVSYGNGHYPSDGHHNPPPYPPSHFRQPYRPFFFARSTFLVPGTLNSYWSDPASSMSQDNYTNDQSAQVSQGQGQDNGNYGSEAAPNDSEQESGMAYQAQDVPPPPGPSEPLTQAAITLIFKDGHSQQVHNYALTKTTLYVLDDAASGRRPEIPLDKIDVAATEETNREAGVDFIIPTAAN